MRNNMNDAIASMSDSLQQSTMDKSEFSKHIRLFQCRTLFQRSGIL